MGNLHTSVSDENTAALNTELTETYMEDDEDEVDEPFTADDFHNMSIEESEKYLYNYFDSYCYIGIKIQLLP